MTDNTAPLKGYICLVTGASRGIGRGIAVQLGAAGATVYVTGRPAALSHSPPGLPNLHMVAAEVTERGGRGIAVHCDHSSPGEAEALFERIRKDTDGRLDLLVNNAFSAIGDISANWGLKFWETEPTLWDKYNNVGLRNHYVCSVHAARMMVPKGRGLIVNISSIGGFNYLFNVPYGVGKAGVDRMAADMAVELRPHNVAVVSLWPAAVKTELFGGLVAELGKEDRPGGGIGSTEIASAVADGESPELSGLCVAALAAHVTWTRKRTGNILFTGDIAQAFGFRDVDGRRPPNYRSLKAAVKLKYKKPRLARFIPGCCKVPKWVMAIDASRL